MCRSVFSEWDVYFIMLQKWTKSYLPTHDYMCLWLYKGKRWPKMFSAVLVSCASLWVCIYCKCLEVLTVYVCSSVNQPKRTVSPWPHQTAPTQRGTRRFRMKMALQWKASKPIIYAVLLQGHLPTNISKDPIISLLQNDVSEWNVQNVLICFEIKLHILREQHLSKDRMIRGSIQTANSRTGVVWPDTSTKEQQAV